MESQGISKAGQTVLDRLMESQIWHQPAGSVVLCSEKGQWPLPAFLSGRELPPALALIPDTSCLPCMPLGPFQLLPWCWSSERVSLVKCMCGFFKRNCLGLQEFLPLTQSSLVFAARSHGDLPSWPWNHELGGLVRGWDSSFPRYPLLNCYLPHVDMGPGCSMSPSPPPYQSGWMRFL